ncbi:phosphogluconate dehydrogenase (NAD(+)-dependent, decarboxylating) [Enterococcus sp. BWR-S5]|uniref:phosphogluconate dehydrogenase (NAD(+)-dependent, decarboxylating) n=1 Tax=Enterococcus sp. BWR-S5 TaxID=2787714 RepID=UPI00192438B2|nr:decarboxylating 6-phosphogluconate dehydrogenase [Enterococcus sp. BWR-S5]MBL1226353.1 decarboxylating 6-phosphogluconate dehydrogenase [Enterococcus sp. BWR-S5]
MNIELIGLGKMGMGILKNLSKKRKYTIHCMDINEKLKAPAEETGAVFFPTLSELLNTRKAEARVVWLMLPAGELTNQTISDCLAFLKKGDTLIDAGNSKYTDSKKNEQLCSEQGVHFFDVGTSGGVDGATNGACMMIGGSSEHYAAIEPLFKDLCVADGVLYCGPAGSGHYLKMIHNGIEYGMMQSIAEGFDILAHAPYDYDLEAAAKVFNHGSVIRSWLMELTENIFRAPEQLDTIEGVIPSSGEGQWTIEEALSLKIAAPVITQSLLFRYSSESKDRTAEKVVALLRNQFGGHAAVKEAVK